MSLKFRIALALALVAALVGVVSAGGAYISTERQVARNVDELLLARARGALSRPERGRNDGDNDDDDDGDDDGLRCPLTVVLQPVAAVQLLASDGSVTPCLDGAITLPVGADDLRLAGAPVGSYVLRTVRTEDDRYRMLSISGQHQTVLQVARDLDEAEGVLDGLRTRLILLALAGIALAAAAGWLIARRIVRPVTDLRDAAETIARTQDLTTPVPGSGQGEVGSLATSFTTMVTALSTSRAQQQRLIADASHEMRTPLTSLRTNIELLEHYDRLGADDRRDTLAAVQVDVGELTNLLTELVELATDRAGDDEPVEPIDLEAITSEIAARAARRSGRDIRVVVDAEPVAVEGRARMIERAITNLVENAVKYSGTGPIDVGLRATGVEVRDEGPGIPEADLPHVFERFYRATTARTAPGSGLGLAIVHQTIERHGGSSWARNRPGQGAAVGFDLPPVPPSA